MSLEENKNIIRRYIEEIWNFGDLTVVEELLAGDFVIHEPGVDVQGHERVKQYVMSNRTAFPDLKFTIESQIGEQDIVVTQWTFTGIQKGEIMGIPATSKHVEIPGISYIRLAGKKLQESWAYWDKLAMLKQLGITQLSG